MKQGEGSNNSIEESIRDAESVRVRYSVVINYIGQLYRLLIALSFAVIITRRLSVEDYGLLNTILGVNGILITMYGIWNYWVPRYFARKRINFVSVAFFMNLVYTPIAVLLMISIGYVYHKLLGIDMYLFVLASILIIITSLRSYLRGVAAGSKPFIIGKAIIVGETARLISAYIFAVLLSLRVYGVIISIFIAGLAGTLLYYLLLCHYGIIIPRPKFSIPHIKKLAKNSYIPLTSAISNMVTQLERPVLTAITVSTNATAYLGVSYIPRSIIAQGSQAFTSGLSAKLLRMPSRIDIEDVLRITFIVNIGITTLLIVMFKPILSLFRAEYLDAWPLFILFALESFLIGLANIFSTIAVSIERRDLYESGLSLADTPLFRVAFARLLRNLLSALLGTVGVFIFTYLNIREPVLLALPYPIVWFVSSIPFLLYTYSLSKEKIKFSIPWREVLVCLIGGLFASFYLVFIRATNIVIRSFWLDLPQLIIHISIAGSIYGLIVLCLSPWTRNFISRALRLYLRPKTIT